LYKKFKTSSWFMIHDSWFWTLFCFSQFGTLAAGYNCVPQFLVLIYIIEIDNIWNFSFEYLEFEILPKRQSKIEILFII
jgi:hypothetical protein